MTTPTSPLTRAALVASINDGALALTSDWNAIGHGDFKFTGPGSFGVEIDTTWAANTNLLEYGFLSAAQIECGAATFNCNTDNDVERFHFRRQDADWRGGGSLRPDSTVVSPIAIFA